MTLQNSTAVCLALLLSVLQLGGCGTDAGRENPAPSTQKSIPGTSAAPHTTALPAAVIDAGTAVVPLRPDMGATPDGAAPDLQLPDMVAPDMPVPDLATPEMATPDAPVPDMVAPDAPVPDLAAPDAATPDLLSTPDGPTCTSCSDACYLDEMDCLQLWCPPCGPNKGACWDMCAMNRKACLKKCPCGGKTPSTPPPPRIPRSAYPC